MCSFVSCLVSLGLGPRCWWCLSQRRACTHLQGALQAVSRDLCVCVGGGRSLLQKPQLLCRGLLPGASLAVCLPQLDRPLAALQQAGAEAVPQLHGNLC